MILKDQVLLDYIDVYHILEMQRCLNNAQLADTYPVVLPYTMEDASLYVEQEIQGRAAGDRYAFAIMAHQTFVGICALYDVNRENNRAGLYYWVAVPFWNKGLATQAISGLINLAKAELGITTFMSGVLERNYASRRVLEKNGFLLEKSLINEEEYHERFLGEVFFEMVLLGGKS